MATKKTDNDEITVVQINRKVIDLCILGVTPFIANAMHNKIQRELLLPKGRKNAAEKASTLKHDPIEEFNNSPYKLPHGPTLIATKATGFKNGMGTASLDLPGTNKTQIRRNLFIRDMMIPIWGTPQLFMSVTRSADTKRTPDVRSRAILPEWACKLRVEFSAPLLNEQTIVNLVAAAGFVSGIGDWRQEKGSGSFGSYTIVDEDNDDFQRIITEQGRAAQEAAMADPECYDSETEELLSWFKTEVKRRGFKTAA